MSAARSPDIARRVAGFGGWFVTTDLCHGWSFYKKLVGQNIMSNDGCYWTNSETTM